MISFVCVLFDGRDDVPEWSRVYDESWVEKLYRGIARNLGGLDFELVCLVDRRRQFTEPVRQVQLAMVQPNWTALMEAFRPELGIERGFLLGLDTVIVGSLAQIVLYAGDFALISDPYRPLQLCNGVTAFSASGAARVWRAWESRGSKRFDLGHRNNPSEMVFMRETFPDAERLDELYPGQIVSYKCHVQEHGLGNARIVYLHGEPKQQQLTDAFVKEHWR